MKNCDNCKRLEEINTRLYEVCKEALRVFEIEYNIRLKEDPDCGELQVARKLRQAIAEVDKK